MLPTFVIGLREGLEAALIVSIIATFLRRNGSSLRGMWIGLVSAVVLSIGVGVTLRLVEQGLPQAKQEAMEAVIGAVAVFFVTGMVLWMRTHARHLKRDLEVAAEQALGDGTTTALSVMVFLAVLREGFETSVFLLSTFQASSDPVASAGGAVLGIVVAVGIGYGIYSGGVRLNLAAFFKYTGVFLIFVAAGLVVSSLRTAHEAGWIQFGQARTVDLSWLAPTGEIRTAVITGVLGIPADPRMVEVLGWLCYLVPMLLLSFWPAAWQLPSKYADRARVGFAGLLVACAAVLAVAVSLPSVDVARSAPLEDGGTATVSVDGDTGSVTLEQDGASGSVTLSDPTDTTIGGADTSWQVASDPADLPTTLSVEELLDYTGQRVPVGLDVSRATGPFDVTWSESDDAQVLTRDGGLLDGRSASKVVLTLTGGGLTSPRVITAESGPAAWQVAPDHARAVAAEVNTAEVDRREQVLWKVVFPAFLLIVAAVVLLQTWRRRRNARAGPVQSPAPAPAQRSDASVG